MFPHYFFTDTATTKIYTLSLHDALPISGEAVGIRLDDHGAAAVPREDRGVDEERPRRRQDLVVQAGDHPRARDHVVRSEEHTSELQSRRDLVCRLLLEKKNK